MAKSRNRQPGLGFGGREMGRRISRIAAAAAMALLVAGCAYNDHFDNRVDRFDIASEQSRDQMILTNIVRASKAEPLAFQSLGQITGSNTSSLQLGLPSLVLGPWPAAAPAARRPRRISSISRSCSAPIPARRASSPTA